MSAKTWQGTQCHTVDLGEHHDDKSIRIFTHVPAAANMAHVVFVLHGVLRNADKYLESWQAHAERYGFVLVCPEFTEEQFPDYQEGEVLIRGKGKFEPDSNNWAFSVIDTVFEAVKSNCSPTAAGYDIYGHSAGAQFVHRMVLLHETKYLRHAVCANAGWYTLPTAEVRWPYGLSPTPQPKYAKSLQVPFSRKMTILLGTADTDPHHKHLRTTEEALSQGPHRFARGQFFFSCAQRQAEREGCALAWELEFVEDVAHDDRKMSVTASKLLATRFIDGGAPHCAVGVTLESRLDIPFTASKALDSNENPQFFLPIEEPGAEAATLDLTSSHPSQLLLLVRSIGEKSFHRLGHWKPEEVVARAGMAEVFATKVTLTLSPLPPGNYVILAGCPDLPSNASVSLMVTLPTPSSPSTVGEGFRGTLHSSSKV